MLYYPIFLNLNNQNVLIVGGGEVAERKVRNLLTYGCHIYIMSLHLTPCLKKLIEEGCITRISQDSLNKCIDQVVMVIAATDDAGFNSQIAARAKERRVPVNVVDQPSDCSFIVPSVVRRGDLQIAISTGGKSPALAKKTRKMLEAIFGPEYGVFLEIMGRIRTKLLSRETTSSENKITFQRVVDSGLLELIRSHDIEGAKTILKSILENDFPVDEILNQVLKGV